MKPRGYALERIQEVASLPTLPAIFREIMTTVQSPSVDWRRLREVISQDPPLAARVLRVANSSYFARREPVRSLESAFLVIGLQEIIAIVTSIGVIGALSQTASGTFDRRILWQHSIVTAKTASLIAHRCNLSSLTGGDEFIAGLLHDIGLILAGQYFPEEFATVMTGVERGENPLELEMAELGNTHPEISSYLAVKWSYPQHLVDVLRWHHEPEKASGDHTLVRLIHFAERLCSWRAGDEPPIDPQSVVDNPQLLIEMLPDATPQALAEYGQALYDLPQRISAFSALSDTLYSV